MVRMSSGGDSKQDYGTPKDFMRVVGWKFGKISFDLAASSENAKADKFFTINDNSLEQDWTQLSGNLWLNPPFKDIKSWVKKCVKTVKERKFKGQILCLVPASVGSNWFKDYVIGNDIYFINGRLTFEGAEDPYPRDCMLVVFRHWDLIDMSWPEPIVDVWDWRKTLDDINR